MLKVGGAFALALAVTTAFGKPIIKERVRILRPAEYNALREGARELDNKTNLDALTLTGLRYVEAQRFKGNKDWFDGTFIHLPEAALLKAKRKQKERWVRVSPRGSSVLQYFFTAKALPSYKTWTENLERWARRSGLDPGRALSQDDQEDVGVVARQLLPRANRRDLPEPGAHHDDVPSPLPEHALPAERQRADARVDRRVIRKVKSRSRESRRARYQYFHSLLFPEVEKPSTGMALVPHPGTFASKTSRGLSTGGCYRSKRRSSSANSSPFRILHWLSIRE